ncbi:hypothetical protein [Jongsikchunia kroppenstedtii]|uniref:hypothetical protein n=1 Tax=Jongsikchunia kroppenstedtii TaxID=1121721 RepID=UPI001FE0D6EA|nr:hypothetical protein [Jongsikchunia kroppenstedtii]
MSGGRTSAVGRMWDFAGSLPGVGEVISLPRRAGEATAESIRAIVDVALDEVIAALSRTDLTPVITQSLDLNRLLETIDLDAVLARLDLNALLAHVDLNMLLERLDLNQVIAKLDLNPVLAELDLNPPIAGIDFDAVLNKVDVNSIVRDATTSVSGEVLNDVRAGSVQADDRVEQLVNRILRRKVDDD